MFYRYFMFTRNFFLVIGFYQFVKISGNLFSKRETDTNVNDLIIGQKRNNQSECIKFPVYHRQIIFL